MLVEMYAHIGTAQLVRGSMYVGEMGKREVAGEVGGDGWVGGSSFVATSACGLLWRISFGRLPCAFQVSGLTLTSLSVIGQVKLNV